MTFIRIIILAFPADICRKPASLARGSRQRLHAGESRLPPWRVHVAQWNGWRHNMAAPVRSVPDMRDNPKTINRSGVYIYNDALSLVQIMKICSFVNKLLHDIYLNKFLKPRQCYTIVNVIWWPTSRKKWNRAAWSIHRAVNTRELSFSRSSRPFTSVWDLGHRVHSHPSGFSVIASIHIRLDSRSSRPFTSVWILGHRVHFGFVFYGTRVSFLTLSGCMNSTAHLNFACLSFHTPALFDMHWLPYHTTFMINL